MDNPWEIVRSFERSLAEFCGAPYAVAVDSGTAAIFLSLKCLNADEIWIPCQTHISVPIAANHAGAKVLFTKEDWREKGYYQLRPFPIWDSACLLQSGMFKRMEGNLICLSFDYKKHLNIGRGGAILCSDQEHYEWLKKARYYGRPERILIDDGGPEFIGWKLHMDPERAARGLVLLNMFQQEGYEPQPLYFSYPDLRQFEVFHAMPKSRS